MRSLMTGLAITVLLLVATSVFSQTYPIFTEDFEDGLGAWTFEVWTGEDPQGTNDIPLWFDPTGVAQNPLPGGDPIHIYGTNEGYSNSYSVGYSSDSQGGWDGNSPQWIQRQFEGVLDPGIYDVTLELDTYVYWEREPDGNLWGVGNRVYVLTDTLYDDVALKFDGQIFNTTAEATVTIAGTVADGDTIEVDTTGTNRVYEFDNDDVFPENGGNVAVRVPVTATLTISGSASDGETISIDTGGVNRVYEFDDDDVFPESGGDLAVRGAAAATVTISGDVTDGESVTMNTGGVSRRYEFDTGDGGISGGVMVSIAPPPNKASAKTALRTVVNGDVSRVCSVAAWVGDSAVLTWIGAGGHGATNAETGANISITNFAYPALTQATAQSRLRSVVNGDASRVCSVAAWVGNDAVLTWIGAGGHGATNAETGANTSITNFAYIPLDKAAAQAALINAVNNDELAPCGARDGEGDDDVLLRWDTDANAYPFATNTNLNDANSVITVTDFAAGPDDDGMRNDSWCGDVISEKPGGGYQGTWEYNGVWRHKVIQGQLDTTEGNIELRLLMYEKEPDAQTVAWDNVSLTITPVGGGEPAFTFSDNFESGLGDWDNFVWPNMTPPNADNNDTPVLFAADDPRLYDNINNPTTTSAGFSSNLGSGDGTPAAWLQRRFENAVTPGMYVVTYEYDAYVYKYRQPNNDAIMLFPSDGTGIYGPNPNPPAPPSPSVGISYDPTEHDGTEVIWLQQQFPEELTPGTYDVTLEADVYVYKAGAQDYEIGSRIFLLTDNRYDDQSYKNPDDDPAPGFRVSRWNQESAGNWLHINTTVQNVTTATGNLEFRLLAQDKMQTNPGPVTIAWDNVSFTIYENDIPANVVFTLSDNFDSGYGNWTVIRPNGDPWGVGNRMPVLTDAEYANPGWWQDSDPGNGFRADYWPGWVTEDGVDKQDWSMNGVWRHVVQEEFVETASGDIEVQLLMYDKHAGAQAVAWDNLSLTFRVFAPGCNNPWPDTDDDDDVDQDDFAVFQACYTGSGNDYTDEACQCVDLQGDNDVDSSDLVYFEACATGPGIPADPSCDDAACCLLGTCAEYVPALCLLQGGEPQDPGITCETAGCPWLAACCLPGGACQEDMLSDECIAAGGAPREEGSDCSQQCTEACCYTSSGYCTDVPPANCPAAYATSKGPGTVCLPNHVCPQ